MQVVYYPPAQGVVVLFKQIFSFLSSMYLPVFIRKFLKQRDMLKFYKKFVNKDDLCFDIGANIGERTNILLKLGANVVAVEPQHKCFNILESKYGGNNKVNLLKLAIGSEEKEAELRICDETNECSTLSEEFISIYKDFSKLNWQTTEKITVTTLENLCKQFGVPKFCKIDVEGYESAVFLGLSSPIKYICFEFNRPMLNDTAKCLETLSLIGNYQCNFIKYEHMTLVLPQWEPIKDFQKHMEQLITNDILTGEIVVALMD